MFSGGSGAAGRVSCLRVAEVCLPAAGKELKHKGYAEEATVFADSLMLNFGT
jgi:hypothetical protein